MIGVILLPLVMALLLTAPSVRPLIVRGLAVAPLPALMLLPAAWISGSLSVTLPGGWILLLDQPGALLLGASTLLWIFAGYAASRWLKGKEGQARFALWWLLTLAGSLGVFLAGDPISFYALYALASLPAYGLIAFSGRPEDRAAARLTLAAALIGEGLILAAFVLMTAGPAPQAGLIIALLVVGFGLKTGLVPLHGWMPLSYAAGPLAATAVLSGATSKAAVIGLIRFLPLQESLPVAGALLCAAGLFSAFYGALVGLSQSNPRSVLAYSSISQLGQMAAVLGAGLMAGAPGVGLAVAYYGAYHVLAKGGLFLALGAQEGGRPLPRPLFLLAALLALGFAGLPLTGGALAKLAVKDVAGQGVVGLLLSLAAMASTVLVLHFLRLLRRSEGSEALAAGSFVLAALAAMALQWSLFSGVTGLPGSYALKPGVIFGLAWPIAAGGCLAWALADVRLPRLRPGDVGAWGFDWLGGRCERLAEALIRFEGSVRRWPVAMMALAGVLVIFVLCQTLISPA